MADRTKIEWTRGDDGSPGATWNPVTGCTKVSPGCDHCYAETTAERFRNVPGHYYESGFDLQLRPDKLDQPLRWKKPRRVFVNSMSDLFHADIPDEYIAKVFAVMALASQHTFQVLTKRPGRMRALLQAADFAALINWEYVCLPSDIPSIRGPQWPLPNVWLGVSAEDQRWADIRIPVLLNTPAAVRFVSAEPLLGPIRFDHVWLTNGTCHTQCRGLDWVIVGGESGRGARPMHPDWVRSIRDQCQAAEVAFHFKQRGEWTWNEPGRFTVPQRPLTDRVAVMHPAGMTALTKDNPFDPFAVAHPNWATRIERVGKRGAGRELDGRTWDEYPEAV
jgi:protein gp37